MNPISHYFSYNSYPSLIGENVFNSVSMQNKKITYIALAALSCLAFAYLFYYCIKRYLINETFDLEDTMSETDTSIDFLSDLQESLINQIESCQATKNLYQLAEKTIKDVKDLPLQVKIVLATDNALKGSQGICSWYTGEIFISSKLTRNRAFSVLVFELANATQALEFQKVHEAYVKKELSKQEQALAFEQIEYTYVLLHTTIIKDAIVEKGLTWKKYDEYHYAALDEIDHYNRQIDSGHTAYYLNN